MHICYDHCVVLFCGFNLSFEYLHCICLMLLVSKAALCADWGVFTKIVRSILPPKQVCFVLPLNISSINLGCLLLSEILKQYPMQYIIVSVFMIMKVLYVPEFLSVFQTSCKLSWPYSVVAVVVVP